MYEGVKREYESSEIEAVSERIKSIGSSRPIMRLFQETNGFKLRYGQVTEIDTSMDTFISYDEALIADNDELRQFIKTSTPSIDRLLSDIRDFSERESSLIEIYHETIDSKDWQEAEKINNKLKWISAELRNLRQTAEAVI